MQSDPTSTQPVVLAAAPAASALARPSRTKGPLVWLDMDQQELDDAYDQIVYAPNREQITKRRIVNSEKTRALLGAPQRMPYGPSESEKLDIYRTSKANAPVNIFVHGGASPHCEFSASSAGTRLEPFARFKRSLSAQCSCTRPQGSAQ